MSADTTFDDEVKARVTSERRSTLEEIAHERSEPGSRVTVSDLVREAVDEYLDGEESTK